MLQVLIRRQKIGELEFLDVFINYFHPVYFPNSRYSKQSFFKKISCLFFEVLVILWLWKSHLLGSYFSANEMAKTDASRLSELTSQHEANC